MRALAVGLVIVHHFFPLRFTGGYIGVDVFFVISGFLITGLLLREHEATGTISLRDFYARRARRILPAAVLVTLVTILASSLLLPAVRARDILVDSIWVSLFAGNVRFAMVGTDYFAQGEPPSVFQHFWSLGVEEQFYLGWPLLLLLLGFRRSLGRIPAWAVLLAVILAASAAWSLYATAVSPVTAYYSIFTRAWELGLGAACAFLLVRLRPRWSGGVTTIVTVAGLAAVVLAGLVFSPETPFPGYAAALPVVGTALMIVAGGAGPESALSTRLLGWRPLAWIGDLSYSLYLWHWPVLLVVGHQLGYGLLDKALALALVLGLSWLSFRFVETPLRTAGWLRPWPRAVAIYPLTLLLVAVSALGCYQVLRWRLGGFENNPAITAGDYRNSQAETDPAVALVEASVRAAREHRPVPTDLAPPLLGLREQTTDLGDCDYRDGLGRLCPMGDPDADRVLVVLGDSHARAWSSGLMQVGENYGYRVYALVYTGCMASTLTQMDWETGAPKQACEDFKQWADETIADLSPDVTVIATSYGRVYKPGTDTVIGLGRGREFMRVLEGGYQERMEQVRAMSGETFLLANTPRLPRHTGVCLSEEGADLGDCAWPPGETFEQVARTQARAARAAGVEVIDAQPWFCADGLCPSVIGRYITLRDAEHVTPDYARALARPLAEAMGLDDGS